MSDREVIRAYSDAWPEQFRIIASYLEGHLQTYKSIEHVGSTSIPGMDGKSIIDIDIEIETADDFTAIREELVRIGYVYAGNQGIEGREVFKRSGQESGILDTIPHHLYVCPSDSEEFRRHIKFRDTLRKNKELCDEYNKIKHEIIQKVGKYNRQAYVDMKEREYQAFFEKVLKT